jgi:hypothetical protein
MIVGVGASAGGLDAFRSFFGAMPADSGLAFVLVQHLSPNHKSMLAELLGKATAMSVVEATDGAPVEANRVFVIPPDSTLTIAGGRLRVSRPAPPRDHRRPIDTFFQSLAEDQGENAIGIVLAGTGSDGSLGLAAIKESGGMTRAQAESDHRAMPGIAPERPRDGPCRRGVAGRGDAGPPDGLQDAPGERGPPQGRGRRAQGRSFNPRTRSWRPPRRRCSRSTKRSRPSTPRWRVRMSS